MPVESRILNSRTVIGKAARGWSRRVIPMAVLAACAALIPATAVPAGASSYELKVFRHADRTLPWHEEVVSGASRTAPFYLLTRLASVDGTGE